MLVTVNKLNHMIPHGPHALQKKPKNNGIFITDFFPFMSNKINLVLVAHVSSTENVKTFSQSVQEKEK